MWGAGGFGGASLAVAHRWRLSLRSVHDFGDWRRNGAAETLVRPGWRAAAAAETVTAQTALPVAILQSNRQKRIIDGGANSKRSDGKKSHRETLIPLSLSSAQ